MAGYGTKYKQKHQMSANGHQNVLSKVHMSFVKSTYTDFSMVNTILSDVSTSKCIQFMYIKVSGHFLPRPDKL